MRMAINCLAFPVTGRPTRRARRSCSSVASGISERSSRLSGICLALFARALARADDADRFFVISRVPEDHIIVYTLITLQGQSLALLTSAPAWRSLPRVGLESH